jgi:hypothetical protein
MAFNLKPYKEILALTKEKINEALAPIRARSAKAKADLELAKLEEKLLGLEADIHKKAAEKDLDFNAIAELVDKYDLAERRRDQIAKLVSELFPEVAA